jgi:hypothetical protein
MCDALQELAELSLDLQHCDIDLYKADKKIKTLVKVLKERRENSGPYCDKSLAATKCLTFQDFQHHKRDRKDDLPICPNAFYENLKMSFEKTLLDSEDTDLPDGVKVFDSKQ